MYDERHLKVVRFLEGNPKTTQREIAKALGISLGGGQSLPEVVAGGGLGEAREFPEEVPHKLGYLYLLTPEGIAAKSTLTDRFLEARNLKSMRRLQARLRNVAKRAGRGISGELDTV